jgi:putative flippase GtrA
MAQGAAQAGKFGLVGLTSTIIDFALLNLAHTVLGLGLIEANLISTTVAMIFSFILNRKYVFSGGNGSPLRQAVSFFLVTAFGLYVIQSLVIHLLTVTWTAPLHLVIGLLGAIGLGKILSSNFIITNVSKLVATAATLVWNFFFYKRVVFI